jgi:membrane protease YdiL (CAAX protease family)
MVEGLTYRIESKWKLLLIEAIVVLPVLGFIYFQRISFKDAFRFQKVDSRILVISMVMGLGLTAVTDEIDRLIQIFFPMNEEIYQLLVDLMTYHSLNEFIILFLAGVVFAAVGEEMLFRGFLQGTLEKKEDITKAIMTTAFVFAVVHFNPWWLIEILILGVLLGVLVWRTGSILPAIVIHGVYNTVSLLMMNASQNKLNWYLWKDHISPWWILLGLGSIVVGFRWIYLLTERTVTKDI